jgi:hypothetical protein
MPDRLPSAIRASCVAAILLSALAARAAGCDSTDYRAFDFWLGEWNVYGAQGKLAGTNSVTSEYDGCVIHERYRNPRGYRGESLNTFDMGRKLWHQTWVDNSGLLLVLEGGLQDGKMVLEGRTIGKDGMPTRHRITWTPNADGSVRQLWESADGAGAWTISFDGKYVRK